MANDNGYLTPMLLVTGVSFANHWYNTHGQADLKILVTGGLATGILALLNNVPGFPAKGIAWVAFAGLMISPVQNPSPAQNLLKITGQK